MKEYIAYNGTEYTIEWYYNETMESEVFDYFNALTDKVQDKLLMLFARLGDYGVLHDKSKFRNEGEQIYSFKPMPYRFLCFFYTGKKIIITNAFKKKQNKLPTREKEKALKCKEDYIKRTKEGIYYD